MEDTLQEGLKQAMARGQSLQKAMESFYYAGYVKEDIEAAARAIHGMPIQRIPPKQFTAKPLAPKQPVQHVSSYVPQIAKSPLQPKQETMQKASQYKRQDTRPGPDWVLISMILGLLILLGVLGFILFREQILSLLGV